MHTGLYTDMKAIRKDEEVDSIHSLYVEQWDWEKIISGEDRSVEYLKETVKAIYKSLKQTLISIKQSYEFLSLDLSESVYFITSQELEDMYPDLSPKMREFEITKEKQSVFLYHFTKYMEVLYERLGIKAFIRGRSKGY